MPLSEDSRALLTLLLGRGKSYADISGLLGVDEAEVQGRAAAAISEIDASDPPLDPDLTDYLLGQSDQIARADVERRLGSDAALKDRVDSIADQLRLLVPASSVPTSTGPPSPTSTTATAGTTPPPPEAGNIGKDSPGGFQSITSHQRRLIAVLLGGALLAAVVILLVTGVIGGGSDDSSDEPEPAPTVAVLQPVGNEQGSGQIQFGFAGQALAANVQISDLKPNRKGQGYVLWLHGSTGSFPFFATRVGQEGSISGQVPDLNEAVICLIASDFFPTIRVSRASNREFNRALSQASVEDEEDVELPKYTGKTVLEGSISMPQSAKDTIVPICNGTANQNQ